MEAATCARPATGYTYARREPEKTVLSRVLQQHLLTFEQEWTDKSDGRTLPSFVTDELRDFLDCGVLARGFAKPSPPPLSINVLATLKQFVACPVCESTCTGHRYCA